MTHRFNRRRFAKKGAQAATAVAAAGWLGVPQILAEPSPDSKLNIAGIGVGGRGGAHVTSSLGEHLVAVCDVVEATLNSCLKRVEKTYRQSKLDWPLPQRFCDYREMLDKLHDKSAFDEMKITRMPPSYPGGGALSS